MSATKELWEQYAPIAQALNEQLDVIGAAVERLEAQNAELLAALIRCEAALSDCWIEAGEDGNAALGAARVAIRNARRRDPDGIGGALMPGGRE